MNLFKQYNKAAEEVYAEAFDFYYEDQTGLTDDGHLYESACEYAFDERETWIRENPIKKWYAAKLEAESIQELRDEYQELYNDVR